MRHTLFHVALWMSLLCSTACGVRQASSQGVKDMQASTGASPQPLASAEAARPWIQIGDVFIDGGELNYQGYVVEKRYKKVNVNAGVAKEPPLRVEISYAVVKRGGKILAQFDDVYFGMGNSTNFGLFPFLGGDAKQLVVSQDIFRGGKQWIVSLSPRFRVIYDGNEFGAGREADDMGVVDLDGDGVYEITQPVTAFYGFSERIPTGRTPLPTVIFKYNTKAQKYLPANTQFKDYLLRDMDEAKKRISGPEDRSEHLADTLSIVLDYVYAGEEPAGWSFYDDAYNLPDKEEMKKKIKAELKDEAVYRFMYGKSGGR